MNLQSNFQSVFMRKRKNGLSANCTPCESQAMRHVDHMMAMMRFRIQPLSVYLPRRSVYFAWESEVMLQTLDTTAVSRLEHSPATDCSSLHVARVRANRLPGSSRMSNGDEKTAG